MTRPPSYLGVFMRHRYNRLAMAGAGCAAILASIPFGLTGLALVGVVALGAEALAALGVPDLPSFRAWVDREHATQQRTQRRRQLLEELNGYGDAAALASYDHMYTRVNALYRTAADERTTLKRQDVEKLDDLTVDYLGLCVLNLSLRRRRDHANEETVVKRIAAIEAQLRNKALSAEEARQLRATLAQYTETMERSRRLAIRRSGLEAMLISMPDKMEEVYQLVMAAPYSSDTGDKLEESLARLRIAEEVAAEFDADESLDLQAQPALSAKVPATPARAVRAAARSINT